MWGAYQNVLANLGDVAQSDVKEKVIVHFVLMPLVLFELGVICDSMTLLMPLQSCELDVITRCVLT